MVALVPRETVAGAQAPAIHRVMVGTRVACSRCHRLISILLRVMGMRPIAIRRSEVECLVRIARALLNTSYLERVSSHQRYDMKFAIPIIFAHFLAITSGGAWAQTACPSGVASGSAQCGPSTMTEPASTSAPPVPQSRWADSWGGMASDVKSGISGIVTDFPSKRRAKRAAIEECKIRGGEECVVAITYKNQCLAVVDGNKSYIVSSPTIERAINLAMHDCVQGGGNNCHVYYSGCSLAKRIQ